MRFLFLILFLLSLLTNSHAQPKKVQAGEIIGLWKGEIQLVNHNTRNTDPSYLYLGKMVMSVDGFGNVIGRIDNDCAFEGTTSGYGYKSPAVLDVKLRRCPDPEFNRRFKGVLTVDGQILMNWEMMDDIYPIVVRLNGVLVKSKKNK